MLILLNSVDSVDSGHWFWNVSPTRITRIQNPQNPLPLTSEVKPICKLKDQRPVLAGDGFG